MRDVADIAIEPWYGTDAEAVAYLQGEGSCSQPTEKLMRKPGWGGGGVRWGGVGGGRGGGWVGLELVSNFCGSATSHFGSPNHDAPIWLRLKLGVCSLWSVSWFVFEHQKRLKEGLKSTGRNSQLKARSGWHGRGKSGLHAVWKLS